MEKIRTLIHESVPDVTESIKWSRPVFTAKTDFLYFKSTKSYLTVGFFKYEKIKEATHLLEGTGKGMRHIKIKRLEDLNQDVLRIWLKQLSA